MATLIRIASFVVVQLVLVGGLAELGVRGARRMVPGLSSILYMPTIAAAYDEAERLDELLEHSVLGFKPCTPTPGFVLNSRGFRTREYTGEKPAGTTRVLAIGDSFTFSSGLLPNRQHWGPILERELTGIWHRRVEVLRLAAPGVGPQFEYRLWQLEGSRLDADLVVLAFFVGNDFTDEQGEEAVRVLGRDGLLDRLARRLLVVRALRNVRLMLRGTDAAAARTVELCREQPNPVGMPCGTEIPGYEQRFDPGVPRLSSEALLGIERARMSLCRRDRRQDFERLFGEVSTVVEAMHREVTASGARFVVMVIPDQYQVDARLRARILAGTPHAPADYDLRLLQRSLAAFFASAGIESVDLLDSFLERAPSGPLYGLGDTHWNRAGNQLAAEQLARALAPG